MKKTLISVVILFALVFATIEIYFRVEFSEELRDKHYPLIYLPDSVYGYRYIPGITERIDAPGLHKTFKLNSRGYMGPEFNLQKDKGIYRIMVVGSSNSGGIWMEGDRNYITNLQNNFRKHGRTNVEVINCGVDGAGRDKRHIDIIERELLKYKPDMILMELTFPLNYIPVNREVYKGYMIEYRVNSKESRGEAIDLADRTRAHWFLGFLYNISYTVRAIAKGPFHDGAENEELHTYVHKFVRYKWAYSYSVDASLKHLATIQNKVERSGCRFQLFNYDSVGRKTDSLLQRNHIQPLYLQVKFDYTSFSRRDDSHFNLKGHRLIGDSLYTRLNRLPDVTEKIKMLANQQ